MDPVSVTYKPRHGNKWAGFEKEGAIGAIYLVLKDRWAEDRPF